jgi:hypothetical protein
MKMFRKLGDSKALSAGRKHGRLPCLAAALFLFVAVLLPSSKASAQEPGGAGPGAPMQTAARGKVPPAPSAQQPGVSSRGSASGLVTFEEGQLSINATNVSLSEILFAVRAATGADIDVPMNASSERVTAQLGPGPARKVLADLLGWSSFDYIIQGADDDPLAVHSITLMVRVKTGAPGTSAAAASIEPRPGFQNRPEPANSPGTEGAMGGSIEPRAGFQNRPEPANSPGTESAVDPSAAAADNPEPPPNSQPKVQTTPAQAWSGSSGGTKAPSEMIQELQQMYQQRRLLQQQQNQAAGQQSP